MVVGVKESEGFVFCIVPQANRLEISDIISCDTIVPHILLEIAVAARCNLLDSSLRKQRYKSSVVLL